MQLSAIILAALSTATVSFAQDCTETSAIPTCGVPCITSAASAVGCTTTPDIPCQCSNSAAIESAAIGCVVGNCGIETALQLRDAVAAVCTACV